MQLTCKTIKLGGSIGGLCHAMRSLLEFEQMIGCLHASISPVFLSPADFRSQCLTAEQLAAN